MTPDNQTRIVEGIVSMIELSVAEATAAQKTLKEQVTQVSSHGRNLEDSLRVAREKFATLEEQASTMTRHGRTLQDSLRIAHDEITRLTRALESDTPSASRLKSIKLDVAKFGGGDVSIAVALDTFPPHVRHLAVWLALFLPCRAKYPLASSSKQPT
ncbi:hypothetical protein DYB26_004908 [Aphanomyces astaci]|uniref:Uncharacterized protein n=1 Tax=Aphanomyces astaci TaxID=112090 RepID=A0A3R7BAZ5_APHAT|nr:hypothetical protein DYB26_004908 [Aphanomyces astaci]